MDILTVFMVIILASVVHASFHLSTSTMLSLGNSLLSKKKNNYTITKLSLAMVFGCISASIILFSSFAHFSELFYDITFSKITWAIIVGLLISTGISIWLFYYKKNKDSNSLWIPASMSKYIATRTKKAVHSAESFYLGFVSIFTEILFFFAPLSVATLLASILPLAYQFVAIVLYVSIVNFPIFVIACLISGGHNIIDIQKWRDRNKGFFQFFAGLGLILMSVWVILVFFTPNIVKGI